MRSGIWTAAVLAAVLASGAAQAQAAKFDGRWSVEVVTEKGECGVYRWPVIVERGRVRYGGPENFTVTGAVAANGRVSGAIVRGQDRAVVTGRLSDGQGGGTWTASGSSRNCSGRWNAERRG
jgi:hypothetical protein